MTDHLNAFVSHMQNSWFCCEGAKLLIDSLMAVLLQLLFMTETNSIHFIASSIESSFRAQVNGSVVFISLYPYMSRDM